MAEEDEDANYGLFGTEFEPLQDEQSWLTFIKTKFTNIWMILWCSGMA